MLTKMLNLIGVFDWAMAPHRLKAELL